MAGIAGGIGAIFRAPLGAAFFSAECLYSKPEFEYEVLLPGLISAITGYSIYSSYAGWGFLFDVPAIAFSTRASCCCTPFSAWFAHWSERSTRGSSTDSGIGFSSRCRYRHG